MSTAVATNIATVPPPTSISSNLEPGLADIVIRSRQTVLEILEMRGYDTTVYQNIAPEQLLTLADSTSRALDVFVPKREGSEAPCDRAVVVHFLNERIRTRLVSLRNTIYSGPTNPTGADPTGANAIKLGDDVIVIVNEPYHDDFDKVSLEVWQQERARMVFFHIKSLVVNPARHVLVPPHRKLTVDEAKAAMERLHVTSKVQLPTIRHFDVQARVLGLVPGDIVEILRPSPTSGVARVLRACTA